MKEKSLTPSPTPRPARAVTRMKGVPMQDRVIQRRALLLDAALEAFGTRGYHAVTVREICAGARLTERYFYESFKSLEALFSALYLTLNEQLKSATLGALMAAQMKTATSPDRERIDALSSAGLRVLLEFIRDDPRRARVMLIDAISISHGVGQISGQITREYAELTRRFIEQLFPDAEARGIDIAVIATGLLGANIHIATQWVRDGFKPSFEVVLRNNLAIYQALSAFWPKLPAVDAVPPRNS